MTVHNHDTEDGPGLACPESRINGELKGKCMSARQVIPEAAVEAALNASLTFKHQRGMDNAANHMRHILEAAAPHMLAPRRSLLTPCHDAAISAVKDHDEEVEIYCSHDGCSNLWDFDGDVVYMAGPTP